MKVSNQLNPNTIKTTDQPLELKQGDVFTATIKERLPNNEAVVQIRGKEARVVFDDKIPNQDRVAIQVTNSQNGVIHVQSVAVKTTEPAAEAEMHHIFRTLGIQDSPELKALAKLFIERGQPLNKNTMEQIKSFLEKSSGSFQQKFETVKAVADKGIEVTEFHLKSVHEALHGKALSAAIKEIEFMLKPDSLKAQTVTNSTSGSMALETQKGEVTPIRTMLTEGIQRLQSGTNIEESLRWIQQQLQTNKEIPQSVQQVLTKAVQESKQLLQKGYPERAKHHMTQAIEQAYKSLAETTNAKTPIENNKELVQTPTNQSRGVNGVVQPSTSNTSSAQAIDVNSIRTVLTEGIQRLQSGTNIEESLRWIEQQLQVNKEIPQSVQQALTKALQESMQLLKKGYPEYAKQWMTQAFNQAAKSLQDSNMTSVVDSNKGIEAVFNGSQLREAEGSSVPSNLSAIRALLLQSIQHIQNGANLEESLKFFAEQLKTISEMPKAMFDAITKALEESIQLMQKGSFENAKQHLLQALNQELGRLPESTRDSVVQKVVQVEHQLRNGADIKQAVNEIRQHIVPKLPDALQVEIGRKLHEVERLVSMNQERRAMSSITTTLDQLETTLSIQEQVGEQMDDLIARAERGMLQEVANPENYAPALTSLEATTKQFIVTEVTRRMSQLAIDFKGQKREIIRNIDNIINTVQVSKSQSYAQVKSLLESTIDKLDRAILKSDIMLYSDMKSEKQLLMVSSQLADAKKALAKGDHEQALHILQSAKEQLFELNIKPANVKIRHMLLQEVARQGQPMVYRPEQMQLEQLSERLYPAERSARTIFEIFRALGLNYDSEVAQTLSNKNAYSQEQLQNNLKAILLKLTHGDEDHFAQQRSSAEQIIQHITGQQLLSKYDTGQNLQTMLLNLPYNMNGQQGDLKVYINAKKEGEKIDWENCSIYFLLETKKLGDIGVLISAADRNLSITVKNDQTELKTQMQDIVSRYKERINEIGYNVTSIHFTPFNRNEPMEQNSEKEEVNLIPEAPVGSPTLIKRGFDSRI